MTLDESARKLTVRYQGFTLQAGLSITNGADAIPIAILIFINTSIHTHIFYKQLVLNIYLIYSNLTSLP